MLLLLVLACAHQPQLPAVAPASVAAHGDEELQPARVLRREARAAEAQGDLQRAFDLAREAYVAHPSVSALRLVERLEARLRQGTGVAQLRAASSPTAAR